MARGVIRQVPLSQDRFADLLQAEDRKGEGAGVSLVVAEQLRVAQEALGVASYATEVVPFGIVGLMGHDCLRRSSVAFSNPTEPRAAVRASASNAAWLMAMRITRIYFFSCSRKSCAAMARTSLGL